MTPQETISKLLRVIDSSVNQFVKGLTPVQDQTYKKLLTLVKDLDIYVDGTLKNNLANIKVIGGLKSELEKIILNDNYLSQVAEFTDTFNAVKNLQNEYFSTIAVKFSEKKVFNEIKKQAVNTTVEGLTESGIGAAYTDEIKQMLTTSITSGGSYADLTKQLSNYVLGDSETEGQLIKYGRQIATDSINQYSAQYTKAVTDDLGLTYFQYVGSLLTTSRPFCKEMVEKRYFHKTEVTDMLNGKIGDKKVPLGKDGLPQGMISGTNEQTFFVNRGGYNCGHQIFPVPLASVPEEIRAKFEN